MSYKISKSGCGVSGSKAYDKSYDALVVDCKTSCETSCKKKCDPCPTPCKVEEDPCHLPYIHKKKDCAGCHEYELNVCPPECLMKDICYKNLFCALKQAILFYRLDILLRDLTQAKYADFLAIAQEVANRTDCGRIVITLPDGTVVVDTEAVNNSWINYQAKTIGDNHNTRCAVFHAQCEKCGVGYEKKLSSTTGRTEKYVAIRLGEHLCNFGTVRLSIPVHCV